MKICNETIYSSKARGGGNFTVVLNKDANELAILDREQREVWARTPTGEAPHEVAASDNGRRAYVAEREAYT